MSNQKKNISDEAARARKILAKNEPNKVSGLSKRNTTLTDGAGQLGPHFVVQIVHPNGMEQFTVTRPIGYTDLDSDGDWVVFSTDWIPATLKRKEDPSEGELNQRRAQKRTEMAVTAGLLIEKTGDDGTKVFYYPKDVVTPRNAHLQKANDLLKAARKPIKEKIEKADKKSAGPLKQELATLSDPTSFMDAELALAEKELRKFWARPNVVQAVEAAHPRLHRTMTGPFGDQSQVPINGAHGMTVQTLIDAFSKNILEMDVSESPTVELNRGAPPNLPPPRTPGVVGSTSPQSVSGREGGGTASSVKSTKSGKSSIVKSLTSAVSGKGGD